MGDGGIMIQGGIGYRGKTEIKFITAQLNWLIYKQINAYTTRIAENKYIFQRDNAVVHTVKPDKTILCKNNTVRSQPFYNTNFFVCKVSGLEYYRKLLREFGKGLSYQNGRQFANINELKKFIA